MRTAESVSSGWTQVARLWNTWNLNRSLPPQRCGFLDYGPAKPTGTPPGARTTAMVTPGITWVGGSISSAPARRAVSKAARAFATWTEKLLPGASDGLVLRIPPPPWSEYANRWYSPPSGMGKLGLNVQPRTLAHQAFVAAGSALASSVCVIQP